MKLSYILMVMLAIAVIFPSYNNAQSLVGDWACAYATWDDNSNGTGYNTISVAALDNDKFIALVNRTDSYYLVGYSAADSGSGRLGQYGYGGEMAGYKMQWSNFFDVANLEDPYDIAFVKDNIVIVANNDANGNILAFELGDDSVYTHPLRLETGDNPSRAIDVDANGRVYMTKIKDTGSESFVLVFDNFDNESGWSSATDHSGSPLTTITLPDTGEARGITVNDDGTELFVSNYHAKKVYKYTGDPVGGYTLDNTFNFNFSDEKISTGGDTLVPGPWGMKYSSKYNAVFFAADVDFKTGSGYEYAKIFALNPDDAAILDTIDVAEWNFALTGAYNDRTGGTVPGNASGYSSTFYIDFDDMGNLYSQSYYGWTVEKWVFTPATGIKQTSEIIPSKFELSQNYPNPFNPTTTISFSIPSKSNISLNVYDINGQLVEKLINSGEFGAGTYDVTFNASNLASGMYIYTLRAGNNFVSKKMTLIK